MEKTTREKILAIILLFMLTETEVTKIAVAIAIARKNAWKAAYCYACLNAGYPKEITVPDALAKHIDENAEKIALIIAATWKQDVLNAATTFVDAYEKANETLDGVMSPLKDMLSQWTQAHIEDKATTISNYETGQSGNDGTMQAVNDLVEDSEDDETQVVSLDDIWVGVLPDEVKSPDVCDNWAGLMIPLSQAESSGYADVTFPAHPNCPHYKTVIKWSDTP